MFESTNRSLSRQHTLPHREFEVMFLHLNWPPRIPRGCLWLTTADKFTKFTVDFSLAEIKCVSMCLENPPREKERKRVTFGSVLGGSQAHWQTGQPDVRRQRRWNLPWALQQYVSNMCVSSWFFLGDLGVSVKQLRAAKIAWVSPECFVFVECEIKDHCLTLVNGSYYADD